MKIAYRLFISVIAPLAIYGQSSASAVILKVTSPCEVCSLVLDYPFIQEVEQAGNSPFIRIQVDDQITSQVESTLVSDSRVSWLAEDKEFFSPDPRSGHGSSVAAIYDRFATYDQNMNLWSQINFGTSRRKYLPVKVGIVDTGVSPNQPGILRNVIAGQSFVPGSLTIDDLPSGCDTNLNGDFDEGAGHGTMVAGLIQQMVPSAPLIIAKSADSDGMGTSWSVICGVVFCVENGAKVVNISLGSTNPLEQLSEFLDWIELSGVLVVAPIGNDAANICLYPAAYPTVVCVTGLLPDNTRAPFSNWSPLARVSAPATGIQSAWYDGGTAVWSGTSFAAPLVAGCAAAAWVVNPAKTPAEVRDAIRDSGVNIDGLNPPYTGQIGRLIDFDALFTALKH